MSQVPPGMLALARKLRELSALKGWKVTTDRDESVINLRYPQKDKAVGPKMARAIRGVLGCEELIPNGVRLSIRLQE